MIDYANLKFHPTCEKVVDAICSKVGTKENAFFRVHVAYYTAVMAGHMRTSFSVPGSNPEPVNFYGVNLAPSGFGKGYSTSIIETNVINMFQKYFVEQTFAAAAEINLPKIAIRRATRKQTDMDDELARVNKEFTSNGSLLFSFDEATPPAVKQLRNTLLMAEAGSLNLQTDEIGSNLCKSRDAMTLFLELFSGYTKQKLVKNTAENQRVEEMFGLTPTNMMLFGTGGALLNGGDIEDQFNTMLATGYARRCFFGFIPDNFVEKGIALTAQERLDTAKKGASDTILANISTAFGNLANVVNLGRELIVPDATSLLYFEYQNDCAERASKLPVHDEVRRAELKQRFFKTMKLAGAYAFIDQSAEITIDHLENAIALAEESGRSFEKLMTRDRPYVRLAKYLAEVANEVTTTDLVEALPFYKGTKGHRDDLTTQATAWGYKNSILVKRSYLDGIEFFEGETLEETDQTEMQVSYGSHMAYNYLSQKLPFDQLHQLTQAPGMHWINHALLDGDKGQGHRNDDNCIAGFNMVVIDVDNNIPLIQAKALLAGYKAHWYTTKRHTATEHRYRIAIPTNYKLELNSEDFKIFMNNLFEWLPFDSDTATGQRERKWLSNAGHYEYTDGRSIDVLPFIPKTAKNEEYQRRAVDLQKLDNLERWVIQHTGDGNRNNQLLRYALILVDGNASIKQVQELVLSLNSKIPGPLDPIEVLGTIMKTVTNAIHKRNTI